MFGLHYTCSQFFEPWEFICQHFRNTLEHFCLVINLLPIFGCWIFILDLSVTELRNCFWEKAGEDASIMMRRVEENKESSAKKTEEVQEVRKALYSKLEVIGNLVHDSVPVSNNEVCMDFSILSEV